MIRRPRAAGADRRRRSGPPDETRWWVPADQRVAESALLHRRDLGRGWIPVPMVNNDERVDPYGDDDASAEMRAARDALVLTALDEGQAWRRRDDGALVVLRVEAFAGDAAAIRARWSDLAEPCLDAVWRQRWREREREPGWIEARWRTPSDRPDRLRPASPVEEILGPPVLRPWPAPGRDRR